MSGSRPRIAVVGHVEWVLFGYAAAPPAAGQIVHLADPFEEPAGGAAVAAVTLARAGVDVVFFTALAADAEGMEARRRLRAEGIDVRAAVRPGRQARAVTVLDDAGDRTIIVVQPNAYPRADDDLGWEELADCAAVYATCAEPSAIVEARSAGALVCSARQLEALRTSGVRADVVVGSAGDRGEQVDASLLAEQADAIVVTDGTRGGRWQRAAEGGSWAAVAAARERRDAYGAGDSFAAGMTLGLGLGEALDAAVRRGAEWGAAAVARRGPYGG